MAVQPFLGIKEEVESKNGYAACSVPFAFSFQILLAKKRSVYLVEIGEHDDYLDVPPQFWSWSGYQASTGHKINHSKKPNGGYTECVHPRFGRILCLVTLKVNDI